MRNLYERYEDRNRRIYELYKSLKSVHCSKKRSISKDKGTSEHIIAIERIKRNSANSATERDGNRTNTAEHG